MRLYRLICLTLLLTLSSPIWAQQSGADVTVDYNNPKKYIVGGVKLEGNEHFSPEQVLQLSSLQEGMEVTVPSEEMTNIVRRLWAQRFFDDVSIAIDSLVPTRDTAYFKISIVERPRVSRWTFSGVKSGEEK